MWLYIFQWSHSYHLFISYKNLFKFQKIYYYTHHQISSQEETFAVVDDLIHCFFLETIELESSLFIFRLCFAESFAMRLHRSRLRRRSKATAVGESYVKARGDKRVCVIIAFHFIYHSAKI